MPERREKVRLTHKFAELIDGIDLSRVRAGDEIELSSREARLLILEGWAVARNHNRHVHSKATAADKPAQKRRRSSRAAKAARR